jgi:hypothetical protein
MKTELLQVEFRYRNKPRSEYDSTFSSKKITIGLFDSLADAIEPANKVVDKLNVMGFRINGAFGQRNGCFGSATRLLTDFYSKNRPMDVFVSITHLDNTSLEDAFSEAMTSNREFKKWDSANQ